MTDNSQWSPAGTVFDPLPRSIYVTALFVIGTLSTLVTPALIDGWARRYDWSESQLGLAVAVELAALAAGSLSALIWQRRWNWRKMALLAIVLAVAGNLSGLTLSSFVSVCVSRFVCGFGGGIMTGVYSAYVANARSPQRIIALTTLTQLIVLAVFMWGSTALLEAFSVYGLYLAFSLLLASLTPFISVAPAYWPQDLEDDGGRNGERLGGFQHKHIAGLAVLLAFLPYGVFQGGIFAFLGYIGQEAAELTSAQTLNMLGFAVAGSGIGPIAAFLIDRRLGLIAPIVAALIVQSLAIAALTLGTYSQIQFMFYAAALQAGWTFLICYLSAALIKLDNYLMPASTPMNSFGLAMGASVIGLSIEHCGLAGALIVGLANLVIIAVCVLPNVSDTPLRFSST